MTADRRADEQAELLRRRGAEVVHAPVVRTLPFDDDRPLREATDAVLARPPDVVVATTGIGMRGWFGAAEAWGLDGDLLAALAPARLFARGPKALAALQQVGLDGGRSEPSERLDRLVEQVLAEGVDGARVVVQRYGEPVPWAVEALTAAGAEVVEIPVYRWVAADDGTAARRLAGDVVAGRVDAVTFTSAAAVRSFVALDDDGALVAALADRVLAVAVGPVTAESLVRAGVPAPCAPARGRLGLLVRALSDEADRRHRHVGIGDAEVVVRGALVAGTAGSVVLGGRERAVFDVLPERPGAVVARATLHRRVWGAGADAAGVDTTVARLRRSLAATGVAVEAVPRRGWALRTAGAR